MKKVNLFNFNYLTAYIYINSGRKNIQKKNVE